MQRDVILLATLVAAHILLAACSSPSSESRRLYEMQANCGNSARDWFSKLHARDAAETSGNFDFGNHYDQKAGRCYLIWNESRGSGPGTFISQTLVDVNENASIGFYLQTLGNEKPTRCEVEGKRCQSSKEWTALVTPYLHE